jgi:hypothetical protein
MRSELSSKPGVFYPIREWKRRFVFFALSGTMWLLIEMVAINLFLWANHHFDPLLDLPLSVGVCIIWFLMSLFAIFLFTKPIRHIVTSEGITFCSLMYRIYTPWNNIRAVGTSRLGIYRPQALLLQEPAVKGTVRGDGSQLRMATIERRRWLTTKKDPPDDAIPLLFTVPANWQESELGFYIKQYAPQVFSTQA